MHKYFRIRIFSLLFITSLCLTSCSDDDNSIPSEETKFTIQGSDYLTPNGYLILDDGPSYTNAFVLGFMDGVLIEDNVNGSSISINTNHAVVLQVELGGANVSSEQDVIITDGTTYTLTNESAALTNITSFSDIHTVNGSSYGEPNAATYFEFTNIGSGVVTINSIVIDYVARTGTVDCDYNITDDNGITIQGMYKGEFNIINEF